MSICSLFHKVVKVHFEGMHVKVCRMREGNSAIHISALKITSMNIVQMFST